jgi:hypothetical protein
LAGSTRYLDVGGGGLDRSSLAAIYSKGGVLIGLYSAVVHFITQGSINFNMQPGLDTRAQVTSAYYSLDRRPARRFRDEASLSVFLKVSGKSVGSRSSCCRRCSVGSLRFG